ncbi:TPA: hypothetical protein GF082_03145 [Citrobacter braakii]|uniref:hypothetical protein n=1 Tax=Citrobacter portucalensis TaxID=1639133 RepID=UPI001A1C036B|nr:hypothetical protein [Citrobacter portucalensis]ECP0346902.1 hypothetical protein [Salmonella enterica]MEB0898327.1 hypothetical protein [Citrobacter portucalensis]HAT7998482.1 hypothetical protein [Citrobacter braakii]
MTQMLEKHACFMNMNGGHDKFIVNGQTDGQTQTASPAFIRKEHRLIAGALRWLPGVQPDVFCSFLLPFFD